MEIIYLGFVLFILAVGATFVWDKVALDIKNRKEFAAANPKPPPRKSTVSASDIPSAISKRQIDDVLRQCAQFKQSGKNTVNISTTRGDKDVLVQDLIDQLERLKKRI